MGLVPVLAVAEHGEDVVPEARHGVVAAQLRVDGSRDRFHEGEQD